MSWNLLIYSPGGTSLGDLDAVKGALNDTFPGLEWLSSTEAGLSVDGGFTFELRVEDGEVPDIYTNGGYNHLKQFAALCKQQGWGLADAQEAEAVDLEDPVKWYEERME